jgi:acetoin utilization deacetylase AcuC-like enzyme
VNLYFSPAYVAAAHVFDTTRKAGWVADSLAAVPIRGVTLVEPVPLTWEEVEQVHDPEYVAAVREGRPRHLAESQGFAWDPELGPMVLASNGGVVAAACDALLHGVAGSLSSGLHHARREHGAGFCTFNGLALAVHGVLERGAGAVLIVDLDAHCGGGTASLLADEPRVQQFDVPVNAFDLYPSSTMFRLERVRRAADYLPTIERGLAEITRSGARYDLCLYNAGMDPFEGCSTGGLPGITANVLAARERLVFAWCRDRGLPVAFVLAGGYIGAGVTVDELVALHRLTIAEAAAEGQNSGKGRK